MARLLRALASAVLLRGATLAAPAPTNQPNVLLFIADDMRSQLGGVAGVDDAGGLMQTPNVAKLASEGTVFTHAYAQEALCAPSRNVSRGHLLH